MPYNVCALLYLELIYQIMHKNNIHMKIVDDSALDIYFNDGDDETGVGGDDNTVSYKYTLPFPLENPNRSPSASPIIMSPTVL